MSDPRRILLVTKLRYIGDTVIATPAFRAIAQHYPNATVDLFAGLPGAQAMQGCPFVDKITVIDRASRRRPFELWRTAKGLRGYDLAVIFDRSIRSALVCKIAGIRERVGFAAEYRGPLLTKVVHYDRSQPEVDCLLELAAAAGAPAAGRNLELWVSDEERAQASRQFSLEGRQFVTMAPAANEPHLRQWPADRGLEVGPRAVRVDRDGAPAREERRDLLLCRDRQRPRRA